MDDKDFSELGREIEEKVNKFINSKEMKDLQENIRQTVESTVHEVKRTAKDVTDYVNQNVEIRWESSPKSSADAAAEKKDSEEKDAGKTATEKKAEKLRKKKQLPIVKKPSGKALGGWLNFGGTIGTIVNLWQAADLALGIIDVQGWVLSGLLGSEALLAELGTAAVFAGTAAIGSRLESRGKRFKKYVKSIGGEDFYSIENLAQTVEKTEKYVIRDLKQMMKRGWFKEGHLDDQETYFMLTDEAYQRYLEARAEAQRQKEEEERLAKEQEELERDPVKKQLRLTIEEGNEYIRRIRRINDEIPGEEISGKLYRLERVCTRIFEYVERNPDKLSDIRKFMNYYLPTTLKLVEKYYEFETQPVQGENITAARREIEETLDGISAAFEKMFDKLYAEDAMDVSTDISVLSTMLAQEGLLADEFK